MNKNLSNQDKLSVSSRINNYWNQRKAAERLKEIISPIVDDKKKTFMGWQFAPECGKEFMDALVAKSKEKEANRERYERMMGRK